MSGFSGPGLVAGSIFWAALMAASATLVLTLWNWRSPDQVNLIIALYFIGGLLAWPLAVFMLKFTAPHRSRETAFTSAFIFFSLSTIATTTALFIVQFQMFRMSLHDHHTLLNAKTVWSVAMTVYQFAVIGMRLYLPFGLFVVLGASWWYAKSTKRRALLEMEH
ncbi:MAG: hypothetical protein ACRECW_14875 [Phyllobacterium sp.]